MYLGTKEGDFGEFIGLASYNAICQPEWNYAIVAAHTHHTAYVMAHEIGHK